MPVLDLSGARAITVQTGPNAGDTETLDFATALLRVRGSVKFIVNDAELSGSMLFEQTTRANGTKVIKIGITQLRLTLGEGFEIGPATGLIFITNLGMAAQFEVPVSFAIGGDSLAFSGTLELGINNTNVAVDETFDVDGTPRRLQLDKGPYLRLAGKQVTITMLGNSVKGDFVFESITRANGTKVTRIAALNVSACLRRPELRRGHADRRPRRLRLPAADDQRRRRRGHAERRLHRRRRPDPGQRRGLPGDQHHDRRGRRDDPLRDRLGPDPVHRPRLPRRRPQPVGEDRRLPRR